MSETATKDETPRKDMKDVLTAAEKMNCPVQQAETFVEEFLSEPMCGKCHPCALGSYEALVRLRRISRGAGRQQDIDVIARIADDMLEASRCIKGKDTAKFLLNALKSDAFREHLEGHCEPQECRSYVVYRVMPEKCELCGLCKEACRYSAIQGEKRVSYRSGYLPYEIRQKRCVKCGDCVPACPYGAIEVVEEKTGVLV